MKDLEIVIFPDDRLRSVSTNVESINSEVRNLVKNMLSYMHQKDGLGLAAIQIGINKNIFVIDIPKNNTNEENKSEFKAYGGPYVMINPEIVKLSDETIVLEEGCLSFPGQLLYKIERPRDVILKYTDENAQEQMIKATDWLARCILHEYDHLKGILHIDYLSKMKKDIVTNKAKKIKHSLKS